MAVAGVLNGADASGVSEVTVITSSSSGMMVIS